MYGITCTTSDFETCCNLSQDFARKPGPCSNGSLSPFGLKQHPVQLHKPGRPSRLAIGAFGAPCNWLEKISEPHVGTGPAVNRAAASFLERCWRNIAMSPTTLYAPTSFSIASNCSFR